MNCALCNEFVEENELVCGEALEVDGEFWHSECYVEYYGEELEEAV